MGLIKKVVGVVVLALALSPIAASAAPPAFLAQFPSEPSKGSGAGQFGAAFVVEANPVTGDIYVGDRTLNRIARYDAWGAFISAWGWGVADGAGEAQTCGPTEPQLEPDPSLCQAGIAGSGPGQFNKVNGVATDSSGAVYVFESRNARVQKFSAAGDFLLMFGGDVNKTTAAEVCTAADIEGGDECGAGVKGSDPGFFGSDNLNENRDALTVAADGRVFVGDQDRIQIFEPDGTYESEIPLPEPGYPLALATDPVSGDLYFTYRTSLNYTPEPPIYRLDADTGAVLDVLTVDRPGEGSVRGLATDQEGNLFASFHGDTGDDRVDRVVQFGPNGEVLIGFAEAFAATESSYAGGDKVRAMTDLTANAAGDLYVPASNSLGFEAGSYSAIRAYGPPPILYGEPPNVPPAIGAQFATAVGAEDASVRAKINPRFWSDTAYYVEYGTGSCESSICKRVPAASEITLTEAITQAQLDTEDVELDDLSPETTYHYRFVAQSGGGGPAYGPDATFTTLPATALRESCANDAYRTGAAARLPDCRAYEMVSPVDKNGADISTLQTSDNYLTGLDQAADQGGLLTYSAYRAFADAEAAPYTSQYLAERSSDGWLTESIAPPREGISYYEGQRLVTQYKAFTGDLCAGWLLQDTENSLGLGSIAGWPNLYRRDICAGGYEAVSPRRVPETIEPDELEPHLQAISADGSIALVAAKGKLAGNGTATAKQVYEVRKGAPVRLVCVLPSGFAHTGDCVVGQGHTGNPWSLSAISADGEVIYWTDHAADSGNLYARVGRTETVLVSESGDAQFWAASADGSSAFYSTGEGIERKLWRFDLATESSTQIGSGFRGYVAADEDASIVYFISTQELASGASAGGQNLFRYQAGEPGTTTFIATLEDAAVGGENGISLIAAEPLRHRSRVSPDGSVLAFMSTTPLTGYDNTDVESEEPDAEVFLYRADADELICASCNPTGARPNGRFVSSVQGEDLWVAGQIPGAQTALHFPRVLSDDGERLYFESFDRLVAADSNDAQDVYQWEAAGVGDCKPDSSDFDPDKSGCIALISSGQSAEDSSFVDATPDGGDVFFKTYSNLWPEDTELLDVYDAREGGGFPAPAPPLPGCEGEACQSPSPPPALPPNVSQSFQGPGNGRYCPKGTHKVKRKGKVRCVKNRKKVRKHKHKKHHRAKGRSSR